MTPTLARAIDPIFLHVLRLLDRIAQNESPSAEDERVRIRSLIDQAEATLGGGSEWELIKYAIVAWIDEMLVDAPWDGNSWWSNNVLEMEFFNSRLCNEQFFIRAQQASSLPRRDALEVFYICVVLGFRGLYHDMNMAAVTAESLNLSPDLAIWTKQAAMSIRLGQDWPALAAPERETFGAPPLHPLTNVIWAWVVACMFGSATLLYLFHLRA